METCEFCGWECIIILTARDIPVGIEVEVKTCPSCRAILSINWKDLK